MLNQANQNDWPKETRKKCPMRVIQTATRAGLSDSLSESACVSTHMYCTLLLLINTLLLHYFPSLWEFFSAKPKGQGPCH